MYHINVSFDNSFYLLWGWIVIAVSPPKMGSRKNNIVIVFERFHIDYLLRGMIYYITCVSINALILLLVFSDHIIGLRSQSASSSRLASRV